MFIAMWAAELGSSCTSLSPAVRPPANMKRILLLDDERAILEGLRCRLHRAGRKWEIACVDSGARILKDDKVSVGEVAQLIATDSAIAARVLQIVNSAFFRLARRITNIEQAVSYLGFTAIRNVALSVEIFAQWRAQDASPLDPDRLQAHVRAVAAAANALTITTPIADDTMLAGLLHDIGYWVLAQECSVELNTAVELALTTAIPLHQAETLVMGASHAEVGAYLLGLWGLPYPVIEAVAHHHQPQRVPQTTFDVLAALATADTLVPTHDVEAFNRALTTEVGVGESYLTSLNAPFDWTDAQRWVAEATIPEEVSS